MEYKLAEHWKLFYDATKALFVLDDLLAEKPNWYYQELFYIKLFGFLDESPKFIAKCKEKFVDSRFMIEWLQHVQCWREELFEILSEDEIIYLQYRRVRAAHMFQNGFEYDTNEPNQNKLKIVCRDGGRKEYSRKDIDASIKKVEAGYSRSDELDRDLDHKIHPILHKMRLDLNDICNSCSCNRKQTNIIENAENL